MFRCGITDYKTAMKWMADLGKDAKECLSYNEKNHAVYGRIIRDKNGVSEIRFYADTYMSDEELDKLSKETSPDILYVVHKH